jgi:hypothetical protein
LLPSREAEPGQVETTLAWTRLTDPDQAAELLPIWFCVRMISLRGSFGLLLTSGDVVLITSVTALPESSSGIILLDIAGVPEGVDQVWRTKHYLGAPVPGATMATVNLAYVVAAVEFVVAEIVELHRRDELEPLTEAERTALGIRTLSLDPLKPHAQGHVGKN